MADQETTDADTPPLDRESAPRRAKKVVAPSRDMLRHKKRSTPLELAETARGLFRGNKVAQLDQVKARSLYRAKDVVGDFLAHADGFGFTLFVLNPYKLPSSAVEILFGTVATPHDLVLAQELARVFNTDLVRAPLYGRDSETWFSLQQTRMIRIIARMTSFKTSFFSECLRTIEGARELTYEGTSFATRLFVTNDLKHLATPAGQRFVKFADPIPMRAALLGQKWARALTMNGTIALVATSRSSMISGVVVMPEDLPATPARVRAGFGDIEDLVVGGVALIMATIHGDIWVRLSNGMTFLRRRGGWQYVDLGPIEALIATFATRDVATIVLRMAFDASFDRRGALFAIVSEPDHVSEIIPDHLRKKQRVNRGVRDLVRGLDILQPAHAVLVRSATAVDGALLLDRDGKVIDAGCLVVNPPQDRIRALKLEPLKDFPGARSTAARNCSVYGLAIKISEDGQISIFRDGRMVIEFG